MERVDFFIMEKVLIIDSVDDALTKRRHALLDNSSLLKQSRIALEYCYAVTLTDEQQLLLDSGVSPDFVLTEVSLFKIIKHAIDLTHPQYVFAHSGFVYRKYTNIFKTVFPQLRQAYPNIKFGIQVRPGMSIDKGAFEMSSSTLEIQNLIFTEALRSKR